MPRKKKVLTALGVAAALLVSAGAYYLYWSYHPHISISSTLPKSNYSDGVYHNEWIAVAFSTHRGIPEAKRVKEELHELWLWNDQIVTELYTYTTPYYIHVSGENEDGRITLRYEGCVTDQNGETMDYKREATFDLFVRKEDFHI